MVNYLAFLGWNPGGEKEIYSTEELLKDFSLERVHKAGAVFNIEKLNWYNNYYLKQKSPQDLRLFVWGDEKPFDASDSQIAKATAIECERSNNTQEIKDKVGLLFNPPSYDKSLLKWKEMTDEEIKKSLETSQKIISQIADNDFSKEKLSAALLMEASKMKNKGELLWPLRVALSGLKNSPPPFDIAEIVGKEKTLARIVQAIKLL